MCFNVTQTHSLISALTCSIAHFPPHLVCARIHTSRDLPHPYFVKPYVCVHTASYVYPLTPSTCAFMDHNRVRVPAALLTVLLDLAIIFWFGFLFIGAYLFFWFYFVTASQIKIRFMMYCIWPSAHIFECR